MNQLFTRFGSLSALAVLLAALGPLGCDSSPAGGGAAGGAGQAPVTLVLGGYTTPLVH